MSVQASTLSAPSPNAASPARMDGWLFLPMIGMFGTLILQLVKLTNAGALFQTLGASGPIEALFITVQFVLNLALFLVAPGWLLVLFFKRDCLFPRLYIRWQVAVGIFVLLDWLLGYALFHATFEAGHVSFFHPSFVRSVLTSAVGLVIWVPYMANSIRVKNTFVN